MAGGIGALFVLVTPAGAVLVVQIVLIVSEDGETAFELRQTVNDAFFNALAVVREQAAYLPRRLPHRPGLFARP